jgi:hypothetical protein
MNTDTNRVRAILISDDKIANRVYNIAMRVAAIFLSDANKFSVIK